MKLKIRPYEFQEDAINFALAKKYSLNGYTMGLGKTLISLATAVRAKGVERILVVCPAFLIPNWRSEINKFVDGGTFHVVSYSSLKNVTDQFESYDMVICDEVHYVKTLTAQRTKLLHKLVHRHRPRYFMGLSGTPVKNRIPEFYSLLRLCHYGGEYPEFKPYMASQWMFSSKFSHKKTKFLGSRKVVSFEGIKNIPELKALLKPVYIRKRTEEVIDLPEQVDREILCSEIDKTDNLLKIAWEAYEGKKKSKSFASGKAISALAKVKYTVDFINENLDQMNRVLIFTDHVQAAKKIFEEIPGSRYVTGETPAEKRKDFVDLINAGEIKILVATIGSLSTGVNITGVNHMIFNDLPWVPADIAQARKRIHRIGQRNVCFYYTILASQVDEVISRTLYKKLEVLEALEDDRAKN